MVLLVPNFPIVFCFSFKSYKFASVLPVHFCKKRKSNSVLLGSYFLYKLSIYDENDS